MTVVKLSDYAKEAESTGPLCITFFSTKLSKRDGSEASLNITVRVDNGDVIGILEAVKSEGGLGEFRGGQYFYLPWPCACVVMHHPDDEPFEIHENVEHES